MPGPAERAAQLRAISDHALTSPPADARPGVGEGGDRAAGCWGRPGPD